jgi:16S rRNA (guanine966-N2)-methyltransferase
LQSTASPNVRPTARRIREVMFRILFRRIRAGRFLDLCAGSGMVGIEAISRGAIIATFVERSAKMCSFIKKNLESCEIKEGHGEVVEMEVVPFLKKWRNAAANGT